MNGADCARKMTTQNQTETCDIGNNNVLKVVIIEGNSGNKIRIGKKPYNNNFASLYSFFS